LSHIGLDAYVSNADEEDVGGQYTVPINRVFQAIICLKNLISTKPLIFIGLVD